MKRLGESTPMPPDAPTGSETGIGERWIFVGTACLGLLVGLAYGPGQVPLLEDNQHYFYMSERFASGVPPHISNFDPKNMLSVIVTGFGIELGRSAGISDILASRVVSLGAFAGGVGLLSLFAYRAVGTATAAVITALALGSLHYLPLMVANGSRPKVLLLLFTAASLVFLTRKRWYAATLSAALGFLTWQPALLLLASVLTALWLENGEVRKLGTAVGVAAIPVAAYEGYFAAAGALGEQLTQAYVFPALYMTGGQFEGIPENLAKMRDLWAWGYSVDVFGIGLTWLVPAVFAAALTVCVARAAAWIDRTDDPWGELRSRPAAVHFTLSMVGALAFTYYDVSGPPDFFFVFPYAAVIIGWAVSTIARGVGAGRAPAAGPSLAIGAGALLVLTSAAGAREARLHPFDLEDQKRLADRVDDWAEAGKGVYAVGTSHLLAFNRTGNWTRYTYFFQGLPAYLRDRERTSTYVPRRDGQLPDVILTSRSFPPGWPDWLAEAGYREGRDEAFARQDIRVWWRPPERASRRAHRLDAGTSGAPSAPKAGSGPDEP